MELKLKHFCKVHHRELKAEQTTLSKGVNIEVETCQDCLERVARKNFEAGIQEGIKQERGVKKWQN